MLTFCIGAKTRLSLKHRAHFSNKSLGFGLRVEALGFRVLGFRSSDLGFRFSHLGFRVLGFRL